MTGLIAAAAFFVLLHLLVSGTRLRGAIVGVVGEGPYMGLFSLASLAGLIWLIVAFGAARHQPADVYWWSITPGTRHIALGLQLIAFLFIVPGLLTKNPTSVKQESALDDPDVAKGMLRITRHPFLWGVAIWAFGHLLVNGHLAAVILFGSLLILALAGPFSIDAKRRRALGESYAAFEAKTSNVPFAAILAGRQKLSLGEIGLWRIAAALIVWAVVLWAHPFLFGASPLGR